jgi:hypothetical protein
MGILLLFIATVGPLTVSAQQTGSTLYWTIREDALFSSEWRLNGVDGTTMEVLPGRALVAMLEAERRISAQYNITPKFLITNKPGLNAFAAEANGQTLVVVYADIISMWMFGQRSSATNLLISIITIRARKKRAPLSSIS